MRTIIAGGRDFTDKDLLFGCLDRVGLSEKDTIISGHAKGTDALGEEYAKEKNIPLEIYPAEWDKYGKSAGPIRNALMASVAEGLIAFWDCKSRGTRNMIEQALKHKLKIIVFDYQGNLLNKNVLKS